MRMRTTIAASAILLALATKVTNAQSSRRCDSSILPQEIQAEIHAQFSSWRIQEPADLSPSARETWGNDKPITCPGVAVGKFELRGPSYAVLLVRANHPDLGYKFLIFSRTAGELFESVTAEEWNGKGAGNYFLHAEPITRWFDRSWIRRLHVQVTDGVLLVDSAETEFEADLYFWVNGKFRHEWVDY